MATIHIKRAIILLIACLCMVGVCFTMQISATTDTPDSGNTVTQPTTEEGSVENGSDEGVTDGNTTVSGTDVPIDSTLSSPESQTTSSKGYENVYIDAPGSNTTNNASNHHSVTTTTSTVTSYTYQPGKTNPLITKYSKYFKIGMYSFGVIGVLCISFLIFYNIKVYQSKKALGITKPQKAKKRKEEENDSNKEPENSQDTVKKKSKKKNKKSGNDKPKHLSE